jgi:hypothetical protein
MDAKWILKGLVESTFVVASILLALAVDEWAQNREYAELADQSLGIFEREIRQNRARLEDASPYHQGIRDLLGQMRELPQAPMDIRSIVEGLTPPVLLNTAWETSLATGALTHMEFEVVSALSLTYSIQEGFSNRTRVERPRVSASDALSAEESREQVEEAYEYVSALARDESELLSVFEQALELIATHRTVGHSDSVPGSVSEDSVRSPSGGG